MIFSLSDIEVEIFLGVEAEERREKQKILVSVCFEAETSKAEKTDSLDDTVDYFALYSFIKSFPQETEYKLLERFYRALFEAVKERFPEARKLKIEIKKFPFEDAIVTVKEV